MSDQTEDPKTDDGTTDADALVEEWESSAGDDDADGGGTGERVLDQDEIDSLLGVDGGDGDEAEVTGVMALLNSAMVNYERLPMLEVVFDRLVRLMSTSLRNFTSDNVEINLDRVSSTRFGDYLNSIPQPAMLAVFKAEEWDNFGLVVIDSALIYSIVDVLLGGRRGTAAMRIEGRPYTTIERRLVERLVRVVLADLSAAFDPLSTVSFRFDRLETNPKFATIVRPGNAALLAGLRIDMEDRGGRLELMVPYATLEPVREMLLQMFMGEKFGRDSIWENHLAGQLWQTEMSIGAVLDEVTLSLRDVLDWKVGSRLMLDCAPDGEIELRCEDCAMFKGRMGRSKGNIAVQITGDVVPVSDGPGQ